MRRLLFTTFLLVTSLSISGCTKESPSVSANPAADPIFQTEILSKIPESAAAFVVYDTSTPAYEKLKNSPWGSSFTISGSGKKLIEQIKADDSPTAKEMQALITALEKIGVLSPDGNIQSTALIAQAVGYAGLPTLDRPDIGIYLAAPSGVNYKEKLAIIETSFRDSGSQPKKETIENAEAFSITVASDNAAGGPPPTQIYFAASEKFLSLGIDKASVGRVFTNPPSNGFKNLSSSPQFGPALEAVKTSDPTIGFAYVSVAALMPSLSPLAQAMQGQSPIDLANQPLDSLVWKQVGGDSSFSTKFAALVNPKTDVQKTVLNALAEASPPVNVGKVPANAALVAGLDARVIKKIQSVLPAMTTEEQKKAFEMISSIQGLNLIIRNNDAGSPFPDLIIYLDSDKPAEMIEIVKSGLMQAISSAGMSGIPWQSKDIAGSATSYISTPLGAGVYVASPAGSSTTVIASSEKCVKDAIAALGGAPNLASNATSGAKGVLASDSAFALYYVNFEEVGNLIDNVKGNLAMFTGGSNELDQYLNTTEIKKLGVSSGSLGYRANVLGGTSVMELAKAK